MEDLIIVACCIAVLIAVNYRTYKRRQIGRRERLKLKNKNKDRK